MKNGSIGYEESEITKEFFATVHIWIMPRYKWMSQLVEDIIDNVGKVLEYAKESMRTNENFEEIKRITNIVKNAFEEEYNK